MERWRKQVVRIVLAVTLGAGAVVATSSPATGAVPPTVTLLPVESGVEAGEVAHYTVRVENGDGDNPITVTSIFSYSLVCVAPTPVEIDPAPAEEEVGTCTRRTRASDTEASPWQASAIVSFTGVSGPDQAESAAAFMPVTFPDHDFPDVTGDEFYAGGLSWAKVFELVAGFNDGTFRGEDPVTRGQIVNMLWHLVEEPVVNTPHGFVDVPAGAFYRQALNWAKARGLVTGFAGNRYRPNQSVTRGQLVNMVHKMVGSPPIGSGPGYNDVSAAFQDAARWVRQLSLFEAVAPTRKLHPTQPATRGEVVYLLHETARLQEAWIRWNKDPVSTWLFDDANVQIPSRQFVLNRVTVYVGETVFWSNDDGTAHTVTSDTGAWTPLDLSSHSSDQVTFDAETYAPGVYLYHCTIHSTMKGRVTVQAPA